MHTIVERFGRLTDRFEVVIVLGSDYTDISTGTELTVNARIAANLGSPVVLVVHGRDRTPDEVRAAAEGAIAELRAHHAQTVALIANRVRAGRAGPTSRPLPTLRHDVVARRPGEPDPVRPDRPGPGRGRRRAAGAGHRSLAGPRSRSA